MSRMDAAPHQIALPLIALFIAVVRIVISVVVGCVETESEAPSMEGVSAAMEAAPMETSHAPPWKPPPPKPPRAEAISGLSTPNEASASKAIIALRNIVTPLMRSPVAAIGASGAIALQHRKPVLHACRSVSLTSPRPEQALATAANAFCERSTQFPDILRRNYSFKTP
jgi:hypothetical protein